MPAAGALTPLVEVAPAAATSAPAQAAAMRPAVVVAALVVATSARALGVVTLRALVVLEVVRPAVRGRVLLVVAPRVVLVLIGTIVELRVVTTGPILGVVMRLVRVVRALVVLEAVLLAARARTATSVRLRAGMIGVDRGGMIGLGLVGVLVVGSRGTSVVGLGGLSVVGGTTGRTGVPTRRGSGRGATIPSSPRTSPGLNSTGA